MASSDMIVLKTNLREIENLKGNLEKELQSLKEKFSQHFSVKYGKLKDGHLCSKKFDEEKISKLLKIKEKLNEIEESLNGKLEQCSDIFKGIQASRSKRRAKKENRRKAKKRKAMRASKNMEKIRSLIFNTVAPMVIDSCNINLEVVATLSKQQVTYLQMLYNEGMLSDKAVATINEYIYIDTSIKTDINAQRAISFDDQKYTNCL
jgi:hypothetical protein